MNKDKEIGYIKYDSRLKQRARVNRQNETKAEKYIWENLLRWKKLMWYKFTRQKMISFFIADFYCSELKLVIEIDWKIHDNRMEYDSERSIEFEKLWINIIRFSNEEILNNLDLVKIKLQKYISPLTRGDAWKAEGFSKNILITGVSKWIWNYLLEWLKQENNIIWISRTKLEEKWIKHLNIDLTKFEDFNKIVNCLKNNDKNLDVVIINAWVGHFGKYEEWIDEKYKEIINLNLLSPILLIKELEPFLEAKAKIIFIWSIIWKKFMKYAAVYQASKFGLRWFAWALKNELKWKKIHIINPRIVDTNFHKEAEIAINTIWRETKKKDILQIVKKILLWVENRFEIDL